MKFGKSIALTSIVVATVLTIATVPASAATINTWGHWSFTNSSTTDAGNLTFSTGQANATWTASGDSGWSVDTDTHATSEYFNAATPIATAFSANGPKSTNNYIRMYAGAGVNQQTYLFVNFATPVPAGDLAIAVSDIDSDYMLVDGKDASDNNIAVADLIGTAGTTSNLDALSFNFCVNRTTSPCSNNTEVVHVTQTMPTQLQFGDYASNTWNTDGASAWIHPSTTVSSLRFQLYNGDTNESSERVWIVQKNEGTLPTDLANTGSNNLQVVAVAAALIAGGYGMVATTRRRRSRR
jgi:LPXTG-motif cell wall-anchored protein